MTLSFKEDNGSISFVLSQLANNYRLTAWEKDFVDSVQERFLGNGELSPKQLEKLSDLWEKY